MTQPPKGWHSRGYLPHYDGEVFQFVTFRLFDSLPQSILRKFEIEAANDKLNHYYEREFQIKIEEYLDQGVGKCYLRIPEVAEVVQETFIYLNQRQLHLAAWVVMPNHVHILFRPQNGNSLSSIMQSIKGNSAYLANKILNRKGTFWQPDYFDRFIRDHQHYEKAISYIENNPVKAGLCREASEWKHSSASSELRTRMSAFH